jgi:phosphocarrier protein HPr
MTVREVEVPNRLGMHARAAARFVHVATRFTAQVRVRKDTRMMDGKSIMGLLLLAAAQGTRIEISADGPDEAAAIEALGTLVQTGFGEDAWSAS